MIIEWRTACTPATYPATVIFHAVVAGVIGGDKAACGAALPDDATRAPSPSRSLRCDACIAKLRVLSGLEVRFRAPGDRRDLVCRATELRAAAMGWMALDFPIPGYRLTYGVSAVGALFAEVDGSPTAWMIDLIARWCAGQWTAEEIREAFHTPFEGER